MEEIKVLYLVRSSETGGFVHISEKDPLDESDAMDAKFILAFNQQDTIQCLLNNGATVTIRAINKLQELTLNIVFVPSDNGSIENFTFCTIMTPYGHCWFKVKNFNMYTGEKLKGMKLFDLEPWSDALLEELCLNRQFFFVGS